MTRLVVRRWGRHLGRSVVVALAAAVITTVVSLPLAHLNQQRRADNRAGDLIGVARHIELVLAGSGSPSPEGEWVVTGTQDGALFLRVFTTRADAIKFIAGNATGTGMELSTRLEAIPYTSDYVLTEANARASVEVSSSDGRVLYSTARVDQWRAEFRKGGTLLPADAWQRASGGGWWPVVDAGPAGPVRGFCSFSSASTWHFDLGELRSVTAPPLGATIRTCVFRSAAQVVMDERSIATDSYAWMVGAVGAAGVAGLLGTLVVSAAVGRLRARISRATRSDTPALVADPRPGGLWSGLTEEVNHSLTRARLSVEQQRSFVADAAHELRSPLTTLLTTLEVAERHPHLVDPVQVNRTSLTQARRLERLTQDLLLLAQLDARTPLRDDLVDLADVVREVTADTGDPGRPIALAIDGPAPTVGDRDAFRRIVQNLVDNAVRHAATGVTVSVHNDGDRARVVVANDGEPVPAEDAERIFERFARLDGARGRDSGGTGLGLAIARGLAQRYGGTLTLAPGRHDGATFVWELLAAR